MVSFSLTVFIFFFSGLGYIVGTEVAKLLGGWQWGLRVSTFMLLTKVNIQGKFCILAKWPHQASTYSVSGFCSIKLLRVFLLPRG